jgi:hypothetical protein
VKITVTCNQKKTHRQSVLVNFLDLFSSAFHPYLLHFLLSQVCYWGFAVFSSVLGGRSGDGGSVAALLSDGVDGADGSVGVLLDGLHPCRWWRPVMAAGRSAGEENQNQGAAVWFVCFSRGGRRWGYSVEAKKFQAGVAAAILFRQVGRSRRE